MTKDTIEAENMNTIELRFEQKKSYPHVTGKNIKVFPFVSNPSADALGEDLRSFQGVIGEVFRNIQGKELVKVLESNHTFNEDLKNFILDKAMSKVETNVPDEMKRVINDLFFDENDNLTKFHTTTLSYLNFVNSEGALKNQSKLIADIFFSNINHNVLNTNADQENLLHKLILESLPELPDIKDDRKETPYVNLFPELSNLFKQDFDLLAENNDLFIKHIDDLSKYYYFQYFAQILINLKTFGKEQIAIKPISFTMDWEILSRSRLNSQSIQWKNHIFPYCMTMFTHANALELLNNIYVNNEPIKDYQHIRSLYNSLPEIDKIVFDEALKGLISKYRNSIANLNAGASWEDCVDKLDIDIERYQFETECDRLLYQLWYSIDYQFEKSTRNAASKRYSSWFIVFCKQTYLKNRGKLGATLVLTQELLLFLTRLCIGKNKKIRLKLLWNEFEKRGIHFDENSKSEIVKLFEKINLIEKKSDSGDAQYVKSII